ncbi:hypothetical protein P3T17_006783 [Paraburkholderia sp. GAS82]
MDRLSSYAVDPVSSQLALLNVLLAIYLICKGMNYVARTLMRRDPPKKSIRSKLARSDESKSTGRVSE